MSLSSQTEPLLLRITKQPYVHKKMVVFYAVEVDYESWSKIDNKTHYIVEIEDKDTATCIDQIDMGAVIKLTPETMLSKVVDINGYKFNRRFINLSSV